MAYWWSPGGRGWCRWCGLFACSWVFEGVGGCAGRRLGRLGCLLVDDLCGAGVGFRVFEVVGGGAGRRLGRLGRLGFLLVDDFCGAGVGLSSVRGCGLRWWLSSRSSRCLRVVASVSVRRASVV